MNNWFRLAGAIILSALLAGCEAAEQLDQPKKPDKGDKPAAAKETPPKPATHKVEKGPFKVEVSLKGIFEAQEMAEVVVRPEAWTPQQQGILMIVSAVDHGTRVKKGDPIIKFDLEKLEQVIQDLQLDLKLAELALKQAEEELPVQEKSAPLELAVTERAQKNADADLKKFLETDRPFAEKAAHFMVKSAGNFLEYAKEELRQLEKMYRRKDLTEETEEIILKRQRNWVEQATFYFRMAELERDQALQVELPRREQLLRDNAAKQVLALDRAKALPLQVNQKRLSLAKMKHDRDKNLERLRKLQKDREALTVKAPADGIVYHGKCSHGQWTGSGPTASRLHRGSMVQPEEVLLTIVQPRPIFVRAVVEEKDLHQVHAGMKCKPVATPYPDVKLSGKVDRVGTIPVTPGNFEARVTVEVGKEADPLMPGMACMVKLTPYARADALTLPAAAVFTDELDDDKHHVFQVGKDGKHTRRDVVIGKKSGNRVEILQGLNEGDEVLQEKPAAGKKTDVPGKEKE